ncbi:MAG: hypothetical protein Q9175_002108 [Cornicularia normoerica]
MKFAEVLIIETRVVEEARVKAEVKSAHIRALKARLREKKTWCQERVSGGSFMSERVDGSEHKKNISTERVKSTWGQDDGGGRTARISISTTLFVEERPKAVEIPEAHEEIIAYSFAKTPLNAAQAPLAAASGIQGTLAIAVLFDGSG